MVNGAKASNILPRFEQLSARDLVVGLNEQKWSSLQLTGYFLDRIKTMNRQVNAVPFILEAGALKQAAESDARRAEGKLRSPLDGLPMTIKDAFRMKDSPSTYGLWLFRNYQPRADCKVIATLRNAGLVFIGRSAVPTASFDWNCKNSVYKECVNPYDATRTPGGSSGGAAAALALGMTPLEFGTDLGGSIRYPAHCCGVFGLRTTEGWLPIDDLGPEPTRGPFEHLVCSGPLAARLDDLDLLLATFESDFPLPRQNPLRSMQKIAYSRSLLDLTPDSSTLSLMEQLIDRLRLKGYTVQEIQPDVDFSQLDRDWAIIVGHEYSSVIPRFMSNRMTKSLFSWWMFQRRLGAGAKVSGLRSGLLTTRKEYEQTLESRRHVLTRVDQFFSEFDCWILPVSPAAAIPRAMCGRPIKTTNGTVEYTKYVGDYFCATSMLGTPALTCPIGKDSGGMPIGVQIHSARFSDRRLVHQVGEWGL